MFYQWGSWWGCITTWILSTDLCTVKLFAGYPVPDTDLFVMNHFGPNCTSHFPGGWVVKMTTVSLVYHTQYKLSGVTSIYQRLIKKKGNQNAHVLCHIKDTQVKNYYSHVMYTRNIIIIHYIHIYYISMGWYKKDAAPLLTHCSYVSLALTHRYGPCIIWIKIYTKYEHVHIYGDPTYFKSSIFVVETELNATLDYVIAFVNHSMWSVIHSLIILISINHLCNALNNDWEQEYI